MKDHMLASLITIVTIVGPFGLLYIVINYPNLVGLLFLIFAGIAALIGTVALYTGALDLIKKK